MNSFTNLVPIPNPDKPGNPNLWGLEMETETGERKKENKTIKNIKKIIF
jgi:hypothetical protein